MAWLIELIKAGLNQLVYESDGKRIRVEAEFLGCLVPASGEAGTGRDFDYFVSGSFRSSLTSSALSLVAS